MRRARGMTLIEITIALAIAGLLVGISVPAISSVTRAQLRTRSGQLAGAIRSLYGATAISGKSCRLVIDLDAGSYSSECAKDAVRLDAEGERAHGGAREATREEELLAQAKERESLSDSDRVKLELAQKSAFAPSGDIPPTQLGTSVRFAEVWVQHQPERYVAGKAYLYFWPSGLAEGASIHLAQGDDVNTLLVSPLTGRVRIVSGKADAPGEP